jgi:hypothetical protein
VYFNGTTDYKIARDRIGIFVGHDGEWLEGQPWLTSSGRSHDYIEKHVFGLGYLERFKYGGDLEAAYMRGAFAAAQALELESI